MYFICDMYILMSLSQGKDFMSNNIQGNRKPVSSASDMMSNMLSKYATFNRGIIRESMQGMESDDQTKVDAVMSENYKKDLMKLSDSYADELLETSEQLDKLEKQVSAREEAALDLLRKQKKHQQDPVLQNLSGMEEDSAIFMRYGGIRYIVFALIAVIMIALTLYHADMNFTGYVLLSVILGSILIFVISYFK